MTKNDAINILRGKISSQIQKEGTNRVQLTSLLWSDAATCFPDAGHKWDGAFFYLDLKDMTLYAEVSTYPGTGGRVYGDKYTITPEQFHDIALKYSFSEELLHMKSKDDWYLIIDGNLNDILSNIPEKQNIIT